MAGFDAAEAEISRLAALYGKICSTSVVLRDAWLLPQGRIEIERAVPDVDEDRQRVLRYSLRVGDKAWPIPMELPASVHAVLPSPSGRFTLRVVQVAMKPKAHWCLELWDGGSLLNRVDGSELHDAITTGGCFGGFSWFASETQVVYVAEDKVPESRSAFDHLRKQAAESSQHLASCHIAVGIGDLDMTVLPASQNLYREDWGGKLDGSDRLALFVADFSGAGCIRKVPNLPADITPGQPLALPTGSIVYVGWKAEKRRLGLLMCSQRPSALYKIDIGAVPQLLTKDHKIAVSPRLSPDGSMIAFLGSTLGFETHGGCFELFLMNVTSGAIKCIVPSVKSPGPDGFAGIFPPGAPRLSSEVLPRQAWGPDCIFFNTQSGACQTVWRVALSGESSLSRVQPPQDFNAETSMNILATANDQMLLAWSTPNSPARLLYLPADDLMGKNEGENLPELGPCAVVAGIASGPSTLDGIIWNVVKVSPEGKAAQPFDAVLLKGEEEAGSGLILFLHGGPHSVSATGFSHSAAFLHRATGCAVLMVNYRGSTGFGQTDLESLTGKVGKQDVEDCMAALHHVLGLGHFDERRLGVVGGSHGGFLTAHLIGQYPHVFRAAAMRNPVTNMASMLSGTDIPDWNFIEGLGMGTYNFRSPAPTTADNIAALWSKSPIAYAAKVTTPTLVALGMKDRRVPPTQGLEFYHALKSRSVETRLLTYKDDGHALDRPATDADHWINIAAWFNEWLPPQMVRGKSTGLGV